MVVFFLTRSFGNVVRGERVHRESDLDCNIDIGSTLHGTSFISTLECIARRRIDYRSLRDLWWEDLRRIYTGGLASITTPDFLWSSYNEWSAGTRQNKAISNVDDGPPYIFFTMIHSGLDDFQVLFIFSSL